MKSRGLIKSTTFKTHFFSALCRSMFTCTSLIFVNSVFVKAVGGKNYSQLFFFASLASMVYYFYFLAHGDRKAYGVYKIVIVLTLIASVLCFLEPFWPVLVPYNNLLLYFFAVSVVVVDLIGTTLGPVILQLSTNPAIFREVYQKIVTAELLARVSAAALIWVLSVNHWLVYWYPVGWITLIVHFFLFNVTIARLRRVEKKQNLAIDDMPVVQKVKKGLKFIFSNDMVRAAMIIMIWAQVTKFVVEYVFYQSADSVLPSARRIAIFVSSTTMAAIVVSLLVQSLVGRMLTSRLQLSTLFSFQPLNILIMAGMALIFQPFWPVVLLLVTYNVINRSIQLPVSRQCLVPVPRRQRSTIVSLICIFMSAATMIASGIMATLKEVLHFQDFLVVLLVLGSVIFFLITGLDSYYIRNLWSFYRESRSGRWQDEPVVESLSPVELESNPSGEVEVVSETGDTASIKSHAVLEVYSVSFDKTELASATRAHRSLVRSVNDEVVLIGLRICFISGFPWLNACIEQSLDRGSSSVKGFAGAAVKVNEEFGHLSSYRSVFVRQIKGLALEFTEEDSESDVKKLKSLLNLDDRPAAESLVAALCEERFKDFRDVLLNCITDDGKRLTLSPVVMRMYRSDYETAHHCRELLARLWFGKNSPELRHAIESNLSSLNKHKLALFSKEPGKERDAVELQRFMHTLFAEEYRLCPNELDRTLTDTIREFSVIEAEDTAMLVDMHLEFLKRSDLFRSWQALMASKSQGMS